MKTILSKTAICIMATAIALLLFWFFILPFFIGDNRELALWTIWDKKERLCVEVRDNWMKEEGMNTFMYEIDKNKVDYNSKLVDYYQKIVSNNNLNGRAFLIYTKDKVYLTHHDWQESKIPDPYTIDQNKLTRDKIAYGFIQIDEAQFCAIIKDSDYFETEMDFRERMSQTP